MYHPERRKSRDDCRGIENILPGGDSFGTKTIMLLFPVRELSHEEVLVIGFHHVFYSDSEGPRRYDHDVYFITARRTPGHLILPDVVFAEVHDACNSKDMPARESPSNLPTTRAHIAVTVIDERCQAYTTLSPWFQVSETNRLEQFTALTEPISVAFCILINAPGIVDEFRFTSRYP